MNATLKVNGLSVDTQAIADGLYSIICDRGEESLVAFGMIPKWIMDLTEKMIREKVIAISAAQMQCTPAELAPYVEEVKIKATVNPIIKQVVSGIYAAAKRSGKMIV